MNTQKKQILSLLIVGTLAVIGAGATESYAQTVVIPVEVRALLSHPALSPSIRLVGGGDVRVSGSQIEPGSFNLADTAGPGRAQISWSTGTIRPSGRFRVQGQAVAEWVDSSGVVRYAHFTMVITGRTNGTDRVRARFRDISGTAGADLRGRCRHR